MFTIDINLGKLDKIDTVIEKALQEGLDEVGQSIVEGAKQTVHVITGDLRDSITILERGKDFVIAGTDLYYAAAEEFGTATRAAHPYLGPQADRMQSEAPRILQQRVNSVL